MKIMVLGDIDSDQLLLELDWTLALRGFGHDVVALLPATTAKPAPDGVTFTHARGLKRLPEAMRLARHVRPELIVACNPVSLCVGALLRTAGFARAIHYHAHEIFTGRLATSPVELAANRYAHRADSVSVPLRERALVLQATHRLSVEPTVVANFRSLVAPDATTEDSYGYVLIADQARWLSDADVQHLAAAIEVWGWRVVVTGRLGAHAVGMVSMEKYRALSRGAVAAISLTRPTTLNFSLAAPYRLGWFLSCAVPQVISRGSYATRFLEAGAATVVDAWAGADEILGGLRTVRRTRDSMRRAAERAFRSWGNLEAELCALPWL